MKENRYNIDIVAGLLLFCAFTVLMLMVLVTGANAYKDISASLETRYNERTCLEYIVAKVRHYNDISETGTNNVRIVDFAGIDALALDEVIEEETYQTLIYVYDGFLYELFTSADAGLMPEDGFRLLPLDKVVFSIGAEGLLKVECILQDRSAAQLIGLLEGGERL